ncbi:endonuclease domain-containing protein [Pontibacter cellulosilyticus]|uniref:Endonuclease domain-containing protein n=1 Tax=Pontibacter cellulosilyticus TaxID=1720253 RepID=A0A923SKM0_9BACT|nr:endonuclease domain-containing protein [Pontibacter cellulosilyticus]MBC5995018.1 endonuclease domain-containing protein [Pontibacter cellulosilyticus]
MTKNRIIPYREDLKAKARELRKNSTLSEILLWQEIKERKLLGYQFHRQVPMLDFIVDFYSHELQLAIEIDGDSHNQNYKYDVKRQAELEQYGVQFIRIDDKEVKRNMNNVLRAIEHWIIEKQRIL